MPNTAALRRGGANKSPRPDVAAVSDGEVSRLCILVRALFLANIKRVAARPPAEQGHRSRERDLVVLHPGDEPRARSPPFSCQPRHAGPRADHVPGSDRIGAPSPPTDDESTGAFGRRRAPWNS